MAIPVYRLLEKESVFEFDATCLKAFVSLKGKLVSAPVIIALDWNLSFEMICDASGFTLGIVLRNIDDAFPDESVMLISQTSVPWYADYANFIVCGLLPEDLSSHQKRKFLVDMKKYVWDKPFLFRKCADNIIRCCVPEVEVQEILDDCDASPASGDHGGICTASKFFQWVTTGLRCLKMPMPFISVLCNVNRKRVF
ncbi:hypothetical protein MTR67_034858 [Solanum verrucosum]|uniref:Reverse transcriptase/retrotransposon-derived protein RNase H-like domain-containing protein n=1 Tax=Solanum verrucosum TaxID=315347 RepID=A0AAF0U909_SOLVR|nr:hypothetical protein MTR67_034858 [Solanum verrucosum]